MAQKAKIKNKLRFERVEKTRTVDVKEKRIYFLIICEGIKTEPNYFEELRKDLPRGTVFVADMTVKGTGRNTESLIDFTIKYREQLTQKFDRVWAVFDRDSFTERQFNSSVSKAESNGICCAWSNEAFELWFVLHFQFVSHSMPRADYQAFIEREVRKKTGDNKYTYRKNYPTTYKILKEVGNQEQAKKWAVTLRSNFDDKKYALHNPCTLVDKLIDELFNPKKVLERLEETLEDAAPHCP